MPKKILYAIIYFCFAAAFTFADVRLPSILSDNMVLQQDMDVPIWGWAQPGEKVSVTGDWGDTKAVMTKADDQGKWMVKIRTPKASDKPLELIVTGENTIVIKNVLAGEVWLCSGQSNMEFPVKSANNGKKEVAAANFDQIRIFVVEQSTSTTPLTDCNGRWVLCNPETIKQFSAVAYYFARQLHNELNVPFGLIGSYWGGTPAQAWTKKEVLQNDPDLISILNKKQRTEQIPQIRKQYQEELAKWQKAMNKNKKDKKLRQQRPFEPEILRPQTYPSTLYNAMISPLIPFGIRGAIWYQGESNVSQACQYRKLFPAMIKNWRTDWQQGNFPFYYVQIAPFAYEKQKNNTRIQGSAAELREAQMMTLSLPDTGMAVTMDIGDTNNIHPTNKQEVGRRLSLWAMAKIYGKKDFVYSGPIYKSMKIEGNKIRLSFDYIGGGLMAKDGQLNEFTIAGQDKKFVPADATIDGDTILVTSDQISNPVSVRFAWNNASVPNLFNKEGLPASSFRTDDWPGITCKDKK